MNIIYLLTNTTNNKKYIGQKVEVIIEEIDGVPTIINNKTQLPYYGSSSNILMQQDLQKNKFKAEILEIVNDKRKMWEKEDFWIKHFNAVNSENYYNLSYPLNYQKRDFQNTVKNEFGELYKEFASNESSIMKRINSARKIGFDKLEDWYVDVYKKIQIGNNLTKISKEYNVERHTIGRLLADVNINKFYDEIQNYTKKEYNTICELRVKGASIKKIGKILNLEFATILYYIGTDKIKNKTCSVSKRKGLTEDELGYKIMKEFLCNKGIDEIGDILNMSPNQVSRSFHRFIRKHIEINDFNGILKE